MGPILLSLIDIVLFWRLFCIECIYKGTFRLSFERFVLFQSVLYRRFHCNHDCCFFLDGQTTHTLTHNRMPLLTIYQREMLKKHVYKSEGCSITEMLILKHFWNWLTLRFPLWLAPNTITFVGLIITLCTTLSVILQDLNCEGKVSTIM